MVNIGDVFILKYDEKDKKNDKKQAIRIIKLTNFNL